ncbi:hypothetical protein EKO04_008095 [Ascochyta lentis]|uniref:NAD(P)-binding protein n=1 Tax=Ascochyta lentis TaxID=205686 RepID=A0A8H7IZF0_9PLEO|nr:hypothetical protein EKO04_008095 [Ascochyta lentis]
MTSIYISDSDLTHIKGQVVIITGIYSHIPFVSVAYIIPGASSDIGLSTLRRVLKHGGKAFVSDLNPLSEPEKSSVPFLKVDVTSWTKQVVSFKAAEEKYGHLDHVFANVGIGPSFSLLEDEVNMRGDLIAPKRNTIEVNLIGCIYTVKLGINYLGKNPRGGSIVATSSASSFARFPRTDYTTTKHAVLGIVRSLYEQSHPNIPICVNAVAPAWTATAILPSEIMESL